MIIDNVTRRLHLCILMFVHRHLCVCKDCFPHIDKCPVCRSLFDDFVTVQKDRLILVKAPTCTRRKLSTSFTSIKIEYEVNEKSSQSVKLKSL